MVKDLIFGSWWGKIRRDNRQQGPPDPKPLNAGTQSPIIDIEIHPT